MSKISTFEKEIEEENKVLEMEKLEKVKLEEEKLQVKESIERPRR